MEVRKDILWRVYLVYLCIVVCGLMVVGRVLYIQTVQGAYWKQFSDSLLLDYKEMDADRGTIFSEDGSMLSSSIPYFDVRIDFGADGLRAREGRLFRDKLDSVCNGLAALFPDKTAASFKSDLKAGYRRKDRYFLLRRNISFREYQSVRELPLVRLGRNRSGFIFEEREKRLTPFGELAARTIGLARSYIDGERRQVNKNVGLELSYDSVLRGVTGRRLVRRIAGGAFVPVEGTEIEPVNGKDILTTIDVNIQEVAHQALMRKMMENEAVQGTCIVMEVATGKVKAIVNLGRQEDGSYHEDMNYAIRKVEPGSTFKLVTLLSMLEDGLVTLDTRVNLEHGVWRIGSSTVFDSETHGRTDVSVKQAFELSSNVGMAKLAVSRYGSRPEAFIAHMRRLGLDSATGLGLVGESSSTIPVPGHPGWSGITLPWMSFGYNISMTPLHTLMVYNAVANGGRMMRPYLVNAVMKDGKLLQAYEPQVLRERICSGSTLAGLRSAMEGVVLEGTAKNIRTPLYGIAGKTGTAKVANGSKGYFDNVYQSSFVGYFPSEKPAYSCIVFIRNRPSARFIYGSIVAAPVFREIADRLYALDVASRPGYKGVPAPDSSSFEWAGWSGDFRTVQRRLPTGMVDSAGRSPWMSVSGAGGRSLVKPLRVDRQVMPSVKGMGLRDALFLLEGMRLKVVTRGRGKVSRQSIDAGARVSAGQTVLLEMGLP